MSAVVDFILVVGIVLTLIALIGILRVKNKELPQYILMAIWIAILDVFLFFYAVIRDFSVLEAIVYYLQDGVRFVIPPLVYIYIKSIFLKSKNLIKKNLIHFVPFLIYLCAYSIPSSLGSESLHIKLIQDHIELALEKDIFGIIYFVLSLRLFYRMKSAMKKNYARITERDFLWIEKFLYSFLIVLFVDLLITISELSFGYDVFWDSYITAVALVVSISYLGYYGLTQSTIFLPEFLIDNHVDQSEDNEPLNFVIKEEERGELMQKFQELMESEKLYLSPEVNLRELSEKMKITERKLSAFFSEVLKSNFYDSINSFRVNEAKKRLKSDAVQSHSIVGIGLSCGFKSKSSFYRIFKKHTGLSPLIYRKQALNES